MSHSKIRLNFGVWVIHGLYNLLVLQFFSAGQYSPFISIEEEIFSWVRLYWMGLVTVSTKIPDYKYN